jgi:hypothetical protein
MAAPIAEGETLVVLSQAPEACTSETGSAATTLAWSVRAGAGKPAFKLIGEDPTTGNRRPLLAVDLDGDGVRELVFAGFPSERVGVLKLSGQEYSVADVVEVPFYDCGC